VLRPRTVLRPRLAVHAGQVVLGELGEGGCWGGPSEAAAGSVVIVEVAQAVLAGMSFAFWVPCTEVGPFFEQDSVE
jgi:hypothetical protein